MVRLLLVTLFSLLLACGSPPGPEVPPGGDGDGGGQQNPDPEPEPPAMTAQCFEAEDLPRVGEVKVHPGPPETFGGTVTVGKDGAGRIDVPVTLDVRRPIRLWARVRALTHGANSLSVSIDGLDTSDPATWDIPVTPVLRWTEVTRRGATGTYYRPDEVEWPGWQDGGAHTVSIVGREPEVELDALCVTSPNVPEPEERFPVAPDRAITASVVDFGAVGDGVTDDTAALQAAFSALTPGSALHLPAGRYRITSEVRLTASDVSIVGDGAAETVIFADLPVNDPTSGSPVTGRAITITGEFEEAPSPLLADAAMFSRAVEVDQSAPFTVGETVVISSDEWGDPAPYYPGLFFRNRANFARITAVVTGAGRKRLELDRPLLGPFLTAHSARVERYRPLKNVVVRDLKVEGTSRPLPTDNADIDLVGALRCERCFFVSLGFEYARKSALDLFRSFETQVIDANVSNVVDTGGGGHGYGVTVNRSQALIVRDSLFHGVIRHAIPVSWGSRESFVFRNRFDRSVPHTNRIASVDIHGQDDYANLIERNTIIGGQPGIIIGGGGTSHGNDGPWNVVRDNYLEGTIDGIAVYKSTFDTIIEGNTIVEPQGYGVRIESGSDRAYVWNNRIEGYVGAGVNISDADAADLRRNVFVPGTGPAVRIRDSAGYSVVDNTTGGAAIDDPGTGTVSGND